MADGPLVIPTGNVTATTVPRGDQKRGVVDGWGDGDETDLNMIVMQIYEDMISDYSDVG